MSQKKSNLKGWDSIEETQGNKKSLTNNGKTKKQPPNERKGGSLRKNANGNRGK